MDWTIHENWYPTKIKPSTVAFSWGDVSLVLFWTSFNWTMRLCLADSELVEVMPYIQWLLLPVNENTHLIEKINPKTSDHKLNMIHSFSICGANGLTYTQIVIFLVLVYMYLTWINHFMKSMLGWVVLRIYIISKLYCGYKYTRPFIIMSGSLKQLWLQVNGHAWFHLLGLRRPVRKGNKRKTQNENICLHCVSNQGPFAF